MAKTGPSISKISGVPVWWHSSLEEVPRGPIIVIGHEFLDALPVHQFQVSNRRAGFEPSFVAFKVAGPSINTPLPRLDVDFLVVCCSKVENWCSTSPVFFQVVASP
jgi:hypothetical protein